MTNPDTCPFCDGHETRTTPEILAVGRPDGRPADSAGWRLRVFPNLYPALRPDADPAVGSALFPTEAGTGRHEVLVLTPDHRGSLATLEPGHLLEVLAAVRARVAALAADPTVAHVLPFANHGPEAGATLSHPHLQILGAARVPELAARKQANLAAWRRDTGRCLVCETLAAEQAAGDRMVLANDRWSCHAPWASRFPFEMRLIPLACQRDITDTDDPDLEALAGLMGSVLRRLVKRHGDLSFNVVLHLAAVGDSAFHWHVDILPRLTRLAGFEAGTGFAINSVTPEAAAHQLRGEGD